MGVEDQYRLRTFDAPNCLGDRDRRALESVSVTSTEVFEAIANKEMICVA